MSIVTTNPVKVTIQLLDHQDLTYQQIFKLAHYIDAYEIEKQLQESLVIDIYEVTKAGKIEFLLTPTSGLTYDELSEHLQTLISYSLEKVNLAKCKWEITQIVFETRVPGKASFVSGNIQKAFKAD